MDFGPVIHYHRRAAGITQQKLARLAGVGKTSIFDIEKGKSGVRFETLEKVCLALNIKICWESPLKAKCEKSLEKDHHEES